MKITHEFLLKQHGKRLTCKIDDLEITDAKIAVEGDSVYICQNLANGVKAQNKFGYKYSWHVSNSDSKYEDYVRGITDLKFHDRDIKDGVFQEDILIGEEAELKVLGVCGEVIFLSSRYDHEKAGKYFTLKGLIDNNYTLKQEENAQKDELLNKANELIAKAEELKKQAEEL